MEHEATASHYAIHTTQAETASYSFRVALPRWCVLASGGLSSWNDITQQ